MCSNFRAKSLGYSIRYAHKRQSSIASRKNQQVLKTAGTVTVPPLLYCGRVARLSSVV
jgi:hypothetical protein